MLNCRTLTADQVQLLKNYETFSVGANKISALSLSKNPHLICPQYKNNYA